MAASGKASAATFGSNFSGQLRKGQPEWAKAGGAAGQSFGARFGATAGKLTANLAKVGLAAFAGAAYLAVKQGSALEDSQARLAVAMRNTGGDATAYAGQLKIVRDRMELWGFTNTDVNKSLGTLTTATGSIAKAMGAEATAANLARFKHMDLASASDILAKAFAGNMRSLKGLNVSIATGATSSAAMEKAQKILADQIASSGGIAKFAAAHHMSLAQAQKLTGEAAAGSIPAMNKLGLVVLPASATAADRFAQITRTLNSRLGGQAAAAAGTAGGKFGVLKTQLTDMAAQIGAAVLPKLVAVLSWLQKSHLLIPILVGVMGALTAAIIVQAAAWALTPFGEIALAIMALVAAIILIKTHWNQIWTWWKAHPLLAHVITVLMGPIGLLVTAIMDIATHWNTLKTVFTSVVGFILGKISTFLGGLLAVVNVAAKMPGPLGAPFKAMQGPLATAKKHVDDLATSIRNIPTKHNTNVTVHGSGSGGVQAHSTGIFKTQGSMLFYPAARGWKVPGYGGGDRWPALLEGGEAVVPKQLTPQVAPLLKRHGVPGFATGGLAGRAVQIAAASPNATATAEAGFERVNMVAFMKAAIAAAKKEVLSGGPGANAIVKDAMSWIGKIPYVWGGTAVPGGADCSGFVQTIYGRHGISAPRTSEAQGAWVRRGAPVPGGLAFYHSPGGGPDPGHVAIVGTGGMVISQGGGMGPQYTGLRSMPLLWTGVPPGGFKKMAAGGLLTEPVLGVGRSGQGYSLAESGPETVTPQADIAALIAEVRTLRTQLVSLLKAAPAQTGAATGAAMGGVTRGAAAAGYYGTRP